MVKPTRRYALALRYKQSAGTAFSFYSNFVEEDPTVELDSELDELMPEVAHKVMVQLALQKRLKEFGDQGKDAVTKELW